MNKPFIADLTYNKRLSGAVDDSRVFLGRRKFAIGSVARQISGTDVGQQRKASAALEQFFRQPRLHAPIVLWSNDCSGNSAVERIGQDGILGVTIGRREGMDGGKEF